MTLSEALTLDEIEARLAGLPDVELLIALGRVRARPPRRLVGFVPLVEPMKVLLRAIVPLGEEEALHQRLASSHRIRRGGWMDWRLAWVDDEAGFSIWSRERGLCWALEGESLVSATHRIERVVGVEAFASDDWVEQGVRVRLQDGSSEVLWSHENAAAALGFDYDGLHLDWDMGWAVSLGRQLAARMGVPYHKCY